MPIKTQSTPWLVTDPGIMETDRYLSSANAPDLEEDVRLCIQSGARNMVLNCASLAYLTAAGLRAFLTIARMMQDVEGALSIQGLKGQPRAIFNAAGMDAFLPVMDDANVSRFPSLHA